MAPTGRPFLAGLAASASADACTPVTPPAVWPQPGQHSPGHTGTMR
jgi:hypothetical protein